MNIQVLSDLHLEFHQDLGEGFINGLDSKDVDVLILAGDITVGDYIPLALDRFCNKYPKVLYVPGNHEYYGCFKEDIEKYINKAITNNKNLVLLDNNVCEFNGVRFLGATLWFARSKANKNYMNDFNVIWNLESWVYDENRKTTKFLKDNVKEGDVVVTHHLPSYNSVHAQYKGSSLNSFFVCDMEDTILENKPKYWIHGHTHCSTDYKLGDTRVVCNPFGYARHELNKDFKDKLILEI